MLDSDEVAGKKTVWKQTAYFLSGDTAENQYSRH